MDATIHSSEEIGNILEEAYNAYLTIQLSEPTFYVESIYADFFSRLVRYLPPSEKDDTLIAIRQLIEESLSESIKALCKVMSQHSVDGSAILELIMNNKVILRRDQQRYNRQLPGRSPKGISWDAWHDYNHYLVSVKLWEGFTNSLRPNFRIDIPVEIDEDIDKLLRPELKPLWGMLEAYKDLGSPLRCGGNVGKAINLKPWPALLKYKKQLGHLDKSYQTSIKTGR